MRVEYKKQEKKEGIEISDDSSIFLTDKKEYVVYAIAYYSTGAFYLICTDDYNVKFPNTFLSIPRYFNESEFDIIDSHFSDYWIKIEDKKREIVSLEHPLMAQNPFFYGEWIDKEDIKYYKLFSQIKKDLDAEDALMSSLFNKEKSDTKIILFQNVFSLEMVFARIKKELIPSPKIPLDNIGEFQNLLLNIEYFVPEKTIWFLFRLDYTFCKNEKEKLQDVLFTSEQFWIEHSEIREFYYYFFEY